MKKILHYFQIPQRGSSFRTECIAGLTTYLTMAYIVLANPLILSDTGMDFGAVFVATCLTIAVGSFLFGVMANYPFAIAPAMGINAYFTYAIVIGMGFPWQSALAVVFLAGLLLLLVSTTHVRAYIVEAMPESLQLAIVSGIGLFIVMVALRSVGFYPVEDGWAFNQAYLLQFAVLLGGGLFIWLLWLLQVPGYLLWGILTITFLSILLGYTEFYGVFSLPPSMEETFLAFDFSNLLHFDVIVVVISLFLVMLFDTTGTLIGLLRQTTKDKTAFTHSFYSRSLRAESLATITGSLLGTSPTTPYVESIVGIKAGGRTGLTAIVVALLFLLTLFLLPLIQSIPSFAVAPALLFIGLSMLSGLALIKWRDITVFLPSLAIIIIIPWTFSITYGLGWGFITYALTCLLTGNYKRCHMMMVGLAIIFGLYFLYDLFWLESI